MSKVIGLTDDGGDSASDTIGASGGAGGGVVGKISLGSVDIRPIGISPSIGTAPGEDWFRGNQWPPENTEPPNGPPAHWPQNANKHFTPITAAVPLGSPVVAALPPRAWDPAFYQIVLLTEFARAWAPNPVMEATLQGILTAALTPPNPDKEKENLIALIEFRDGVLSEVLSQMTGFDVYFQGALGYTKATHPCTNYLFQGAMRAAEFAAMYYKNLFQRARPWQLWSQLMPPVAVPGHASFPSAHSTQSHTVAAVLQTVAAGVVPSIVDVTTRLAQRISRGREVLGLHYPSDTAAGEVLAAEVAATFMGCPTVARLITAAQQEWQSYTL